ncbi:MAG: M15 family metallopeptidase [Aquihabitans sp.]
MDQEDRLAELADEVHRARTAEARRRIQRRRSLALIAAVAVLALVSLPAVIVLRGEGSGASVEPSAEPATTTAPSDAARPRAADAAATVTTDPRPAAAPPVGTTPDPADLLVLVDRERNLPVGWAPTGMVAPALAWATTDAVERRLLRPEAAQALDQLGRAAARDGVPIIGISAFRSQESQQQVFDRYVRTDGEAAARTFSAQPGHSEHQTGLAVDVTSADGACPTEPCFGATPQAAWLAQHAPEFGFIVRYPAGKELVTTYEAEPWHLRYVGVGPAEAMQRGGLTLDEYLHAA